MASNLPMGAQLEQIYGEIRDHFRALANGFQRLDKIKDSTRQSKQLEELTDKMRECKRLVKEFDRELKDEEARNSPQLNKQLNDEKQSVIKELNSYVALRKTYMTTLGNKKVELFDMGAGVSGEPTAEENVQVASAMSNQELVDAGMKRMDETDQAIERSKQVVEQTLEVGTQIAANLKGQTDQMGRVVNHLDTIQFCRSAVVVSRRLRFQNMGVEEDTKVTRRSSRLSSSVTLENPPTLDDLVFGQEPITVDALLSAFPGRRSQILDLVRLMGPLDSPTLPIMLYGGPSTGKTTLVLHLFNHLHRPFVYSSCRTCYTPRILFESILNQLLLHSKSSSNGYSSSKRCDKPSDFVNLLRQALTNVIDNLHSTSGKPMGKMVYLILDNVDLIRDWDKGSMILHFLFSLSSVLKMPQLGIILISGLPPDVYYSNMGYTYPVPLYFPEYSEEDLRQIFLRNQPNQKLYSAFLDVVLRPFFRVTRRVDQLSNTFSSLFRKFCEPLDDLGISPNEDMKRRLFGHLKPLIAPSLNEIFRVRSHPYDDERQQKASYGSENHGELEILDLHMSTSAKFLLIAAFLASRNPATLDASMFDSTGGIDNRKRKRKASEKSMEKKEIAEQEAAMKGPGSFPLERLLAIFQCIASVGDSSFGEEDGEEEEATGYEKEDNNLMSDILLQVSSLCDANFIIKSGSCPLEGSVRYRSMVSEDLAQKVARSLSFPLSKYLYRR